MKKQIQIILALCCMAALLITGLASWKGKSENRQKQPKGFHIPAATEDLKKRMEQRAIITALVFRDKEILRLYTDAVKAKLAENDQNDESITFDEIVEGKQKYAAAFAPAFMKAYNAILKEGNYFRAESFKGIVEGEPSGRINLDAATADRVFYNNDGAQVYFPYSENFYETGVSSVAVTYHPLQEVESNEAFQPSGITNEEVKTFIVDEDYVEGNPTLVINFNEEGDQITARPQDPPPPAYACNFLTYNTYADSLDDRYVISVTMPKVKLLRNFRTFIGGTNYITLYQCFSKPNNFNINPVPALDPVSPDKRPICHNYRIKRSRVKKWIDFGQIFNDDWRLVQYENPMLMWVKRGWFVNPTGAIDIKFQAGVKLDTVHIPRPGQIDSLVYQWSASFDAGAGVNLHLDIGSKYEYIGSDYVTRRGLLANCIGDNFGNGDATVAGEQTPYAVRKLSDAMLYYFKVRECHKP